MAYEIKPGTDEVLSNTILPLPITGMSATEFNIRKRYVSVRNNILLELFKANRIAHPDATPAVVKENTYKDYLEFIELL